MQWLRIPLIFLTLILGLPGAAYADASPIFQVQEKIQGVSLNPHLEFFEDKSSALTIEQMLDPATQPQFFRPDKKVLSFGFTPSVWWARFQLENPSANPRRILILQHYPLLDEIEFYAVADGRILKRLLSGDMGQRETSDPEYRSPLFTLDVPPGTATVLLRARSKGPMNFEIQAYSEREFHQHHKMEYTFLFSMLSVLFVMALYNLLIYLQLRKTVYLIYVAFLITMMLQPLSYSGLFAELLPQWPFLLNEGYLIDGNASSFLACLYPIYFLSLRNRHPWLTRFCVFGMIMATVATIIALLLPYEIAAIMAGSCSMYASFATLACGVTCSIKRYRPAYFFTAAWSSLIFANLLRILTAFSVLPWLFVTEWGTLIASVFEVTLLSLGLADKIRLTEKSALERIGKLNTDLQKEHAKVVALNEHLEERVEEQTREVKSILTHIQMGILVAKGDQLAITPAFSDHTKSIFHTQQVEGQDLVEFIFQKTRLNADQRSQIRSLLNSCMNEDAINTELNLHALPLEVECFDGSDGQLLQLDWNPVVNDEGVVEKMLVTIKDVTRLKKLESVAAEKSKELAYIGEILEVQPAIFDRFVESSQKFLAENERLIKANRRMNQDILKILFINMHTIKGVTRSLGLQHLTPAVHEAEQNLAALMKDEKPWNQAALLKDLEAVQDLLDVYQTLSQNKLGRDGSGRLGITPDYADSLAHFFGLVEKFGPADLRVGANPLKKVIEDLILIRAETLFREVMANADMLARDLHKEYPQIEIDDQGIHLSQLGQNLIRHTFIHLVRNTMDHGIESAAERVAQGKNPAGLIKVQLKVVQDELIIQYTDDGAGLNLAALQDLARAKGLLRPDSQPSPLETAWVIFEPGLSTCHAANEISGRGVGMSAVKEYIEDAKGSVHIRLLDNPYTRRPGFQNFMLEINLPPACFVVREASEKRFKTSA
ncbi:7TM diverse intracellular signaling domain-containing protein [Oligoflexus tunisiensis]|uniref:7TM diverse intracellular signaling domain-containing protein n=1 Tax=Oligoflexus tunisiensis TaxID=708132 RepID=UPI00159F05C8|nr:7TM diverse intracellular signaling domain-containing protein [Oligoflexus tunisiensis]